MKFIKLRLLELKNLVLLWNCLKVQMPYYISQKIFNEKTSKVEDVLKLGDTIAVKVIGIDDKGRIDVSAKDLLPKPGKMLINHKIPQT